MQIQRSAPHMAAHAITDEMLGQADSIRLRGAQELREAFSLIGRRSSGQVQQIQGVERNSPLLSFYAFI